MIRRCTDSDVPVIEAIVNEAAQAYRGVIPADRWHEPYMSRADLEAEIAAGVDFWGWEEAGTLIGVMGIQLVRDATLIRHAYVSTAHQGRGVGGALMAALVARTTGSLLVGTWAAAEWAIRFYERHGFRLVSTEEKDRLLDSYWTIPARQRETSVVLVRGGSAEPSAGPSVETVGLLVEADLGPGVLHQLSGVIARHGADITLVEILENRPAASRTYFEVVAPSGAEALRDDLAALPIVRGVTAVKTFQQIYGKRIIIMGGGAQVGQVALGAIAEADRHNIRGEHISVDTIPLVGEQTLADAVRAVTRLPRARALVLAGALMGGDIEKAVREVREHGLLVISLNMAGSVPDSADLVVTDPVQAGVMAVMAVADTAKFRLDRLNRRVF